MASTKDVRIALIGYGYWGPNLARNFHQLAGAELAYVVDANPSALDKANRLYACPVSADLDAVLADPTLDAVAIATPARTHFSVAHAALLAGKHVFVEKPLTMDLAEGNALVELAEQRDLTLMVGHVFEYNPAVQYVKQAIDRGDLGEIYYLYSRRVNLGTCAERRQCALEHCPTRYFDRTLSAGRDARGRTLPRCQLPERPGRGCGVPDALLPRKSVMSRARKLAGSQQDA